MKKWAVVWVVACGIVGLTASSAAAADLKDKAASTADKVKETAVETKDKLKDAAVETKDKIKEKTVEAKDKVKAKLDRSDKDKTDKTVSGTHRVTATDVRSAQEALKAEGYDPGPVDGKMGARTRAALKEFQRKHDLTVTGRLDPPTVAKLNHS